VGLLEIVKLGEKTTITGRYSLRVKWEGMSSKSQYRKKAVTQSKDSGATLRPIAKNTSHVWENWNSRSSIRQVGL
jgi:hypothetical protein